MASGSRQATWDPARWSSLGSNLSARTTIPSSPLFPGVRRDLPINSRIDPGQFLGRFTSLVPEVANRGGLGTSPLNGIAPALNPFAQINRNPIGSRRSLGKIEDATPFGAGGVLKFDPETIVPDLTGARTRGQAFQDSLQAAGMSPAMQEALIGRSQSNSPGFGYNPNPSDDGTSDLADVPGLPDGQDLSTFDQGADPRVMNGAPEPSKKKVETVYNENGVIVERLPKGTKHPKTGETLTKDGVWVKRNNGAGKIKQQKNPEKGSLSLSVRNNKGETVWISKSPSGSVIQVWTNENLLATSIKKKERPWDDSFNEQVVTEDTLKRWRAKRDGSVDPTGPDSMVDHDVAKLSQRTVAGVQSTINPVPDGDSGSDDSDGGAQRSKLAPGVGPGVVDPSGPTTGGPLPGKAKGPKPSVGPGKPIGPKGLEGAILSRLGSTQAQAANSAGPELLNSSPEGESLSTDTNRDGEVEQR